MVAKRNCSSYDFGTFELQFDGGRIKLNSSAYLHDIMINGHQKCYMNFTGYRIASYKKLSNPPIILGKGFLDNVYTTFDYDSRKVTFNQVNDHIKIVLDKEDEMEEAIDSYSFIIFMIIIILIAIPTCYIYWKKKYRGTPGIHFAQGTAQPQAIPVKEREKLIIR